MLGHGEHLKLRTAPATAQRPVMRDEADHRTRMTRQIDHASLIGLDHTAITGANGRSIVEEHLDVVEREPAAARAQLEIVDPLARIRQLDLRSRAACIEADIGELITRLIPLLGLLLTVLRKPRIRLCGGDSRERKDKS